MADEARNEVRHEAQEDAEIRLNGRLESVDGGEARLIALNRLHVSARNVRKVRNPEGIPALAAMILSAGGLLNPLAVVPEKRKGSRVETFGVVAGGRRLAALQYLFARGKVPADVPVSCRVFPVGSGVGISLTENASQEGMHPADQLEAFKRLVAEGKSIGQIAAAFGVSPLTVERRLRLASLAPVFLDLYRVGKIELGQMQALALTDDQAQQVQVWEALPSYQRSAHHITQLLTREEVRASEPVARFVGLEAYRAAGGVVRADLFAQGDGGFLQDGDLLNRLALQKLEDRAEQYRAAGWKWAEARMAFSPYTGEFGRVLPGAREPSPEEHKELDRLESDRHAIIERLDALEQTGAEHDGMTEEQEAEWQALDGQRGALEEIIECMEGALQEWAPASLALAGVVVSFDHEGRFLVCEGLVRKEDQKQVEGVGTEGDRQDGVGKKRAEFSAALCQNLTAHRTAAVAAALTQQPKVALAALLLALTVQQREPWRSSPLAVRFNNNQARIRKDALGYAGNKAASVLEAAEAAARDLPESGEALFDTLRGMETDALLGLLAVEVARAYDVFSSEPSRSATHGFDLAAGIERALGVDMADWWEPTPDGYLNHVSKAKMMEAVSQACGVAAAQPLAPMKKADAAAAAAAALTGKRWLPSTLRAYRPDQASNGPIEDGTD